MFGRTSRIFLALWVISGCKNRSFEPLPEPVLVSTGTIGIGGSLSQSLGLAGVLPLESIQVERTLRPLFNPRTSKATDRYEVIRSTTGSFRRLTYWPNSFEYFAVERSSTGVLAARAAKIPLQETLVGASGEIQVSLWDAMIRQGTPPEMIYRFADIFGWRVDFLTEPRQGDTYKMVWKRYAGTGAVKDGDIVCASYQGRETGTVYAFRLAGDYFDVKGDSLRGEFLRAPLAYRRISSRFSNARYHPILRYYRPHHGIDYAAARGTPAVSVGNGVVIFKGWDKGLGNAVRVRHTGSYVSIYGHLSGFARGVRVGGFVKQGQVVGYVGSTGLSTGPHLHFGMEQAGRLINFLAMKSKLKQKRVPLPEREHFKQIQQDAHAFFAQLQQPDVPLQLLKRGQ